MITEEVQLNNCFNELISKGILSSGKLYKDVLEQISGKSEEYILTDVTFLSGSSRVPDLLLLLALIHRYELKVYLEVGTYAGDSIKNISRFCEKAISVTAKPGDDNSMKKWCDERGMVDFSNRLIDKNSNIVQYYCDSRFFNYNQITEKINLYYIDGNHSYDYVFEDTKNIFNTMSDDSFVVWHDFKASNSSYIPYKKVALAVKNALSSEQWNNVYLFDNNKCGIYIPDKYKQDFASYINNNDKTLYTYLLKISIKENLG